MTDRKIVEQVGGPLWPVVWTNHGPYLENDGPLPIHLWLIIIKKLGLLTYCGKYWSAKNAKMCVIHAGPRQLKVCRDYVCDTTVHLR